MSLAFTLPTDESDRRQELQHKVNKSILNSCQTTQGKMSPEITHQYQVNIEIHQRTFLCSSLATLGTLFHVLH